MKRLLLVVLVAGCSADDAIEPTHAVQWDTDSIEAIELPARPSVPASHQVPIAEGPLAPAAPVLANACRASAEIPCDGVDQDCDDTDVCDRDGDGDVEVHLIPGTASATAPLTTE